MRCLGWIGAFVVLLVYALTMSRDLSLFDSPELALVAAQGGLGHPPGQPLHTLLGWLFARVPGVPTLVALNGLSALCGALCVVPAFKLTQRVSAPAYDHGKLAVLVFGALHPVLWEAATRVEVYSLATLLALLAVERMQRAVSAEPVTSRVHPVIVSALCLGLSASANPVIAVCAAASCAPVLLQALVRRSVHWRVLPLAWVAGVLGLSPYAYVLAVASRADVLVWGAPTDTPALVAFLSGNDYRHNTGITWATWLDHLRQWLDASTTRFGSPWLLVGLLASVVLARPASTSAGSPPDSMSAARFVRSVASVWLALAIALVCANHVFRVDNPDYHGYLAGPLWLCVAAAASLVPRVRVAERLRLDVVALLLLLVVSTVLTAPMLWHRSRAADHVTRELVVDALHALPRDAIAVVESDHWIAPAWYLQSVEHVRPDVVVLSAGLSSSSWYWNWLLRQHPTLRTFSLRGPGGRDARMQRFVAAQTGRPVYVEHAALAQRMGLPVCVGGALLKTGACQHDLRAAHVFAQQLDGWMNAHADRVPLATELVAQISLERGRELAQLGASRAALHTMLAGVPARLRHALSIDWRGLGNAPSLQRPPQPWRRVRVLGDPARNAYLAAELLFMAGQRDASQQLASIAVSLGLPEATDTL